MSKKIQTPVRWHVKYLGPIYYVPGPRCEERPCPSTFKEIEEEMLVMAGAVETVECDVRDKNIRGSWVGYRALAYSLQRRTWFSEQWRDAVRRVHLNVPSFMGSAITSYHEAAFIAAELRLDFLEECIPHVTIEGEMSVYEQLVVRGTALAKEVDYIARNWQFEPLDFVGLRAGIQFECTKLKPLKALKEPDPVCRLRIEKSAKPRAIFDGVSYAVPHEVAELLQSAIEANGTSVSMTAHGVRTRQIEDLPSVLMNLLERAGGKGSWIPPDRLWLS